MPGLKPGRDKRLLSLSIGPQQLPTTLRLDKTRPKSRRLALQGQVFVEPAKLASLWSQ